MVFALYPKNKEENETGAYTGGVVIMFRGEYRFLSNFYPCDVTLPAEAFLPEMKFNSVENAYVAAKTLDLEMRKHIATLTAGEAKKLGHEEIFPLRHDYSDERRLNTMRVLVEQKFSTKNPELRQKLLDTKDATLVEGNTWEDDFYGVNLTTGSGKNHLGQILMQVRAKIRIDEDL